MGDSANSAVQFAHRWHALNIVDGVHRITPGVIWVKWGQTTPRIPMRFYSCDTILSNVAHNANISPCVALILPRGKRLATVQHNELVAMNVDTGLADAIS